MRFTLLLCALLVTTLCNAQQSELSKQGLHVIPYPQQVKLQGEKFVLDESVSIVLDNNASKADRFTASELRQLLKKNFGIDVVINRKSSRTIRLTRKGAAKEVGDEGYQLSSSASTVTIKARTEAGLFYGVQTLLQLISKNNEIIGADIVDWPSTARRAMHYDTKHHQDKREYVEELIREFAKYKVNMVVWEWEDKMAYDHHPEIGAPGAFTVKEIQELTQYARDRHIEIVPLVQGLGHASFILKWPQHAGAREIYASNFEFCPLKNSSYNLLFSLWDEAIKATPGSKFIHIGSDETYELGECSNCKKKAEEIGVSGLYHLFIDRAATYLEKKGRKVMAWEAPMNWKQGKNADKNIIPHKGLVITEEYKYETPDLKYAKQAKQLGYPVYAYDPNPGIEHLFLPYFYRKRDGKVVEGSLEESYKFLTSSLSQGVFDGVIRTSWDDSGLPMQAWMLQFVAAAAWSWNAKAPSMDEFTSSFFKNYFGDEENDLKHFFLLLNEGSYFYSSILERWVWHEGAIGKTHLPDLPRGDAVEYDPYWNIQYAQQVKNAHLFLKKMDTAQRIAHRNISSKIDHPFDVEVLNSLAEIFEHSAQTMVDLSNIEYAITHAHQQRFLNHDSTVFYLKSAEKIAADQINRKNTLYERVVTLWEKTRLPKGLSTADKKYFFRQDRTRHFANRTADMRYIFVDEDDLGLEEYVQKLAQFRKSYEAAYVGETEKVVEFGK